MDATNITTGIDTQGKLSGSDRGPGVSDPTEGESTMNSPKRLARIAGALYLGVAIFGGFALGFVYPKIFVAGDAVTTAGNVVANSGLVRLGIVADLIQATLWVFTALTLYRLLKHVNKSVAGSMVVLAALGAGITMLNTVFEFEALRAATGAVNLGAFGAAGSSALVLLLVDAQHNGIFVAQVFMGLWLVPMGYLAYKSGWFPKVLGVMLVVACISYLVDLLAVFLVPDFAKVTHSFGGILPAIAEVWMVVYLLVIGVRSAKTPKAENRIPAAVAMQSAEA